MAAAILREHEAFDHPKANSFLGKFQVFHPRMRANLILPRSMAWRTLLWSAPVPGRSNVWDATARVLFRIFE